MSYFFVHIELLFQQLAYCR